MIRWHLDLAIADPTPKCEAYRVVGSVHQLPVEGDSARHGAVRQVGKWQAIGMLKAWKDTDLGGDHLTRTDAMRAVADWHAANERKATA